MPFTLAHPAAVLPVRRIAGAQLVPLMIGSMVPDLPYYLPARIAERIPATHTWAGTLTVDVPLGVVLLLSAFLLRHPLSALMSERARAVYLAAMERFVHRPVSWLLAPLAILVGAWTHLVWDGFTHRGGFIVQYLPLLDKTVWLGFYHGELCHVLQYVSSVFGLAVLAVWYRNLPEARAHPAHLPTEWRERGILLLVLITAIVVGGLQANEYTRGEPVHRVIYLFLTRITAWFALFYLLAGGLLTVNRKTAAA